MRTPWGRAQDVEELSEGVLRVSTASHGGLKLSRERWEEIPESVRNVFLNPLYAEEDCEEPIALALLGLADDHDRERALKIAQAYERYSTSLFILLGIPDGE